jgi:hypothetical protein
MDLHYKNLSLDDIVYLDDNGVQCVEVWKDVPDYEGVYKVSDLGRVKSLSRLRRSGEGYFITKPIILKQNKIKKGYLNLVLMKNNTRKSMTCHKLVCKAFLNHIPDGTLKIVADHKNNIKNDNRLCNLQLLTNRKNCSKDRVNKTSIFTGVNKININKFKSSIYINGKSIRLGTFETEQEASEYYQKALKSIENDEEIVIKRFVYTSKYKNIYFDKVKDKWVSYAKFKGKRLEYIGAFNSEEEAFNFQQKYLLSIKNGVKIMSNVKVKSSIYNGVAFDKSKNKWGSYFNLNGKKKHIGYFLIEEEAYLARENYISTINK